MGIESALRNDIEPYLGLLERADLVITRLHAASPWTAAKDITEQSRIIRAAVAVASPTPATPATPGDCEAERLLLELERAALVYDRVQVGEKLRRLQESRLWRHTSWLRRRLR